MYVLLNRTIFLKDGTFAIKNVTVIQVNDTGMDGIAQIQGKTFAVRSMLRGIGADGEKVTDVYWRQCFELAEFYSEQDVVVGVTPEGAKYNEEGTLNPHPIVNDVTEGNVPF